MSFERINIDIERKCTAERQSRANACIDSNGASLQYTLDQLEKAYSEIDRMVVALHASEATLKDCQAENDRLTAMLDELRGKQAELVWKCPVSLPGGEWRSGDDKISNGFVNMSLVWARDAYCDWTDPPRKGVWNVTEPGKAVWVRE